MRLRCLHGFLGAPKDFEFLEGGLRERGIHADVVAPALFKLATLSMPECVSEITKQSNGRSEILLGYSMGGRLALQAFVQDKECYKALVIVSASNGGLTPEQAALRLADDDSWARKFENDSWTSLIQKWNERSAFGGADNRLMRREQDYSRVELACALRNWSVARQPDVLPQLANERRPILWMVGERDSSYVSKALAVKKLVPQIELRIIADAAHRVPWENSYRFLDELAAFLRSLKE